MNLEILFKNKRIFLIFLLISLSVGIIESFTRKINYRVEIKYFYNNPPVGAILSCENINGYVSTKCLKENHLRKSIIYLNSQIQPNEKIGGSWDFNNKSIYRYITTRQKDLKFLSKSIQSQFNDLKKKNDIENIQEALTIKKSLDFPESLKFIDSYDENSPNISYKLFKLHFFINAASNFASDSMSLVDYSSPEYKVVLIDNKTYRLMIFLTLGFFASLAFIIIKQSLRS